MSTGRRRLASSAVAGGSVLIALVLAACGAPTSSSPSSDEDAKCPIAAFAESTGPIDVEFWYNEGAKPEETFKALVAKYNSSQDKVKVTATNQAGAPGAASIDNKFVSAVAADQAPDLVESYDPVTAVGTGAILPAEVCYEEAGLSLDEVNPYVRAAATLDGKYQPAWVGTTDSLMFYNSVALDAAQVAVPKNIEELYTAAKALKAIGIETPVAIGVTGSNVSVAALVTTWLNAAGETITDNADAREGEPSASTFDNPKTHQIYEMLSRMKNEGLLSLMTGVDNLYALAKGTAAITFDISGAASSIAALIGADKEAAAALNTAPVPGLDGPAPSLWSGIQVLIVNQSKPEVQGAAWDFATWLAEPEQAAVLLKEASYLPSHGSVLDDPDAKAFLASDALDARLLKPAIADLSAADPSRLYPLLPADVSIAGIEPSLESMIDNGMSPDDAVGQADDAINRIIKQYYG